MSNGIDLLKMFLVIGEMSSEKSTLKEKVAYKERIVFATMKSYNPHWEKPSDWDGLSDEDKMKRLEKVENSLNNNVNG